MYAIRKLLSDKPRLFKVVKLIGFEFIFCLSAYVLVSHFMETTINWWTVLIWTAIFSVIEIAIFSGPKIGDDK